MRDHMGEIPGVSRRQLGGVAVDYDFHRVRARRLRSAARREFARRMGRFILPVLLCALVAAAMWVELRG